MSDPCRVCGGGMLGLGYTCIGCGATGMAVGLMSPAAIEAKIESGELPSRTRAGELHALEFHQRAFDRCIVVRAQLECGHWVRLEPISELALMLAERGELLNTFLDLLDRRMATLKRGCYCVRREP